MQCHASARGLIWLGDDSNYAVVPGDERLQRRHSEFWRAHEDKTKRLGVGGQGSGVGHRLSPRAKVRKYGVIFSYNPQSFTPVPKWPADLCELRGVGLRAATFSLGESRAH